MRTRRLRLPTVHIGGSARGYEGIFAPLASQVSRVMARRAVAAPVYFSLSHKRRASMGAGLVPGIMVYAAEFPLSAA
jgi:hypothetical protein